MIQAEDLHRLLYNAILFSDKKSAVDGDILFVLTGNSLAVYATDDHVAITDVCVVEGGPGAAEFLVPLETAKELEKGLRGCTDLADPPAGRSWRDERDFWYTVIDLVHGRQFSDFSYDEVTFAVNPDRMRKFSLIKTPGRTDYPLDFKFGWNDTLEREVLPFKIGPSVRGVLAPVLRGIIREKFKDEKDVMW